MTSMPMSLVFAIILKAAIGGALVAIVSRFAAAPLLTWLGLAALASILVDALFITLFWDEILKVIDEQIILRRLKGVTQ